MKKVINVISDSNIGGAGKMLLGFLKLASKTEFEHLVIIPKESLLVPELENLGIKYIELERIGEKSFSIGAIKLFFDVFKRFKPDIVHTHASLSARIAARMYGKCKIVHTRHSVFDQSKAKKSFPLKQISGFLNNTFSDVIIAVSPAAMENVVETGTNPKKVTVVFNGVDEVCALSEMEKETVLKKYGLQKTDFICAIIARLESVKGHEYVLRAAKLLEQHENIKILIAGTGGIEAELKKTAAELGVKNVIFTGFIKEIHEIENIMHLQLNASYGTEATSISLLEGMSLGKPALVSDFGGNPYVIADGENGLVVPKCNESALAEGILRIYSDKELYDKLSDGSKNIFNERFTSEAMVKGIEDVYRRLVK